MPQTIKIRRSANTNSPSSLEFGELAWSENGILYIGRNDGSVAPLMRVQALNCIATEAIAANALVSFYDINSITNPYPLGSILIRNANAASGHEANGFVRNAISGGACLVYPLDGFPFTPLVEGDAALTRGASYFLSIVPGRVSSNRVSEGSGYLHQKIGLSVGGQLIARYSEPILRI